MTESRDSRAEHPIAGETVATSWAEHLKRERDALEAKVQRLIAEAEKQGDRLVRTTAERDEALRDVETLNNQRHAHLVRAVAAEKERDEARAQLAALREAAIGLLDARVTGEPVLVDFDRFHALQELLRSWEQ